MNTESADSSTQPVTGHALASAGVPLWWATFIAVFASILAVLVAPGVRGNAAEAVVVNTDRVTAVFAYAMAGVLVALAARGSFELGRNPRFGIGTRMVAVGCVSLAVAMIFPALVYRLPTVPLMLQVLGVSVVSTIASAVAVRAPHTRALGLVAGAFGLAGAVRLVAWEVAVWAGERASEVIYDVARGFATAGVVFEGIGQLAAATWIGTRSRTVGQVLSSMAVVAAFIVTWGAAEGGSSTAARWQSVLHTALADAAGVPPPFGLGAVATYLTVAALLLALVALVHKRELVIVGVCMALCLLSRGSFDVPLRALAASTAAVWIMMIASDERALWTVLLRSKPRRPSLGLQLATESRAPAEDSPVDHNASDDASDDARAAESDPEPAAADSESADASAEARTGDSTGVDASAPPEPEAAEALPVDPDSDRAEPAG